jgi:peroxiredoxin
MVVTASSMQMALGETASPFALPDTEGRLVRLADFAASKAFLIVFMCNHCPYVKHVRTALAALAREYQARGVAVVGINSNDAQAYPDDSPQKMAQEKREAGYTFPYLFDETQEVAKAYRAACTPDFYLFGADRRLFYRGQMDDTRPQRLGPGNYASGDGATGADLRAALEALLSGQAAPAEQRPSIGCNIKWKPGNEPAYFRQ